MRLDHSAQKMQRSAVQIAASTTIHSILLHIADSIQQMSVNCSLNICDDSLGQFSDFTTVLTDDDDHSVDFGTKFEGGQKFNPKYVGYANEYDSDQDVSLTERTAERTKHHPSESSHNIPASRKKLRHLEPESDSSISTFNSEDLDEEKADLTEGVHLLVGKCKAPKPKFPSCVFTILQERKYSLSGYWKA